jgi:hypothetical protein
MPTEDRSSRSSPAEGFSEEITRVDEEDAQMPENMDRGPALNLRTLVDLGVSEFPTKTTKRIFGRTPEDDSLLQEWVTLFMEKQADYGDRADDLGIPGQYAELSRKMLKLRRSMWEGHALVGEPAREVVLDLIGHCFLTLKLMEDNNWGGRGSDV